jgi:hypothetical protein
MSRQMRCGVTLEGSVAVNDTVACLVRYGALTTFNSKYKLNRTIPRSTKITGGGAQRALLPTERPLGTAQKDGQSA